MRNNITFEPTLKTEDYSKDEFRRVSKYDTPEYDVYALLNDHDNYFVMSKGQTPWEHKALAQTDIDGVKNLSKLKLEGATKMYRDNGDNIQNGKMTFIVLDQNEEDTLLQKVKVDEKGEVTEKFNYFVVAWGLQKDGSWNQGHYHTDMKSAEKQFKDRAKSRLSESVNHDDLENHEFFVGDGESGAMYKGISSALAAARSLVTTCERVIISDATLFDKSAE